MDHEMKDRRAEARFLPPPDPAVQATLRPGCAVVLVDVSGRGALVQAPRPLRPGARVHLIVSTTVRRYAIAAHVRRCMVWLLDPLDGVTYRGALEFEERIDWCWLPATAHGPDEHIVPITRANGNQIPAQSHRIARGSDGPSK